MTADGPVPPPPDSAYGAYLERIGAVGTFTARSMTVERAPPSLRTVIEGLRQAAAVGAVRRSSRSPRPGSRPAS